MGTHWRIREKRAERGREGNKERAAVRRRKRGWGGREGWERERQRERERERVTDLEGKWGDSIFGIRVFCSGESWEVGVVG